MNLVFSELFSKIRTCLLIFFALGFFSLSADLSAATYYWIGGASGDWSDGSNWSLTDGGGAAGAYPGAGDTANVCSEATIALTEDITIDAFFISQLNGQSASFTVTISGSQTFTSTTVETYRPSADTGSTETSELILDCTSDIGTLTMHSGANITVPAGQSADIDTVTNVGGAAPATVLTVAGTLTSDTITLSNVDTRTLVITGTVTASTITGTDGSVTNNGTLTVTNTISDELINTASSGTTTATVAGATWTGATSTDWSVASNWAGMVVPSAPTAVTIPSGCTKYPVLSADISVASLSLAASATLGCDTFGMTVTGNVTNGGEITQGSGAFSVGGDVTNSGNLLLGSGTFSVGGDVTNGGSITGGTGTITVTGAVANNDTISFGGGTFSAGSVSNGTGSKISYAGGTSLVWGNSYENLEINTTISDSVDVTAAAVTIGTGGSLSTSGDVTAGPVTFSAAGTISAVNISASSLTFDDAGTLSATGDVSVSGTTNLNSAATIHSAELKLGGNVTGSALTTNGIITNTSSGAITIASLELDGDTTINGGSGLTVTAADYGSKDVTVTGTATLSDGTIKNLFIGDGTTTTSVSGKVTVTDKITVKDDGTFSATDTISVGEVQIESGGTLDSGGKAISVGGNWTNNGTFTHGNAKVTFTDDADVSGSTTFFDAEFQKTADISGSNSFNDVTFDDSATISDTNTFGDVTFNSSATISDTNTFGNVILKDSATISGTNTFSSISATNLGGKTLTVNGTQTVSGSLSLSGTDASGRLSLSGSGSFDAAAADFSGSYLSIGSSVLVSEGGTVSASSFRATHSVPAAGKTVANYQAVNANGWKVQYGNYVWTGAVSTDWNTPGNWRIKSDDGVFDEVAEDVPDETSVVLIPAGCANYPDISSLSSGIEVKVLTIGEALSSDAKITLGAASLTVSGAFSSYGTTIYKDSGRIKSGTSVINDSAHEGTVEFAGTGQTIDLVDYANLVVSGSATSTGAITAKNDVTVKSTGNVTFGGTLSLTNTTEDNLSVSGTATFNGTVTLSGAEDNISVTGTGTAVFVGDMNLSGAKNVLALSGASAEFQGKTTFSGTDITVSGSGEFADAVFSSATAVATVSGPNKFTKFTSSGTGTSITFSDSNSFDDLSLAEGNNVSFGAGKTQTIGSIKTNGTSANPVTLKSTSSGSKWIADFSSAPSNSDFSYTVIQDSESVSQLGLTPAVEYAHDTSVASPTTTNWFSYKYYWLGGTSADWQNGTNWSSDGVNPFTDSSSYPDYENGVSEIIIKKGTSSSAAPYILNLGTGVGGTNPVLIKSMSVESGATVNFASCSVTASSTTSGFTNAGRIRMEGSQNLTGTKSNEAGSVIEYYGAVSSATPWGASYNNIEFTDGATGTVGSAITVAGTTLVANGAGNSLSLSGANAFTGDVFIGANTAHSTSSSTISTISDGGTLTLNCASSFNIAADAECASLTVKSDVSCAGKVTTTGSQTYEKAVGVAGDVSGSDITAIGNATFTGKVTSTAGAQRYEGTVSVGGDVDSKTTITALGAATFDSNVKSIGSQTYRATVSVGGNTEGSDITADGNASFTGTVTTTGAQTYGADASFGGNVSGSQVSVTGETTLGTNGSAISVTTSGTSAITQTYTGAVTLSEDVTLDAGTKTVSFGSTVDGANILTVGTSANKTNVVFGGNVGSSSSLSEITVYGNTTFTGDVTTSGAQTYTGNASLSADSTLTAGGNVTFGTSGTTATPSASGVGSVTSGGKELSVLCGTNTAYFYGGFSDAAKLSLTGNAQIYGSNTFSSIDIDNSGVSSATIVSFDGGTTQTFSAPYSFKGAGSGNELLLTSLDGNSSWWKAVFTTNPDRHGADFDYVKVAYSLSVDNAGSPNPLKIVPTLVHAQELDLDPSNLKTTDWFVFAFYWFGTSDTNWTTKENWCYDAAGTYHALGYPPNDGTSDIVIQANNPEILKLTENISINSLLVTENTVIDFSTYNVTIADTLEVETKGKILLEGTQTVEKASGLPLVYGTSLVLGDESVVEYYDGAISTLALGSKYRKLVFNNSTLSLPSSLDDTSVYETLSFIDGTKGTAEEKFSVTGKTTVANGSANTLSLLGESTFTGGVKISSDESGTNVLGGNITINSAGTLSVLADAECTSLTVKSDVSCAGKVTTTGSQTYEKTVGVTGEVSGSELTAIGNATFSSDVTTTTGAQLYKGTVRVDGNVNSATTITAEKAAVFNSNVESTSSQIYKATVTVSGDTDGSDITADGNATFTGDVTTTGSQVYKAAVTVSGDTAASDITADGNATFTGTVTTSGNQTYNAAASFGDDVTADRLYVTGATTLGANGAAISVTTSGTQTYIGAVSLSADATLTDSAKVTFGTSASSGGGRITSGGNAFTIKSDDLSAAGDVFFYGGFSDAARLSLESENAQIYGSNTFSSIRIDNSVPASATTVSFEGGKKQTIGTISAKGNTFANALTMNSTSSDRWLVYFNSTAPVRSDFSFVIVKDSTSDTELGLVSSKKYASDYCDYVVSEPTTTRWFSHKYYWFGGTSTNWIDNTANCKNWAFDEDGSEYLDADSYPNFKNGLSEIIVLKGTSSTADPHILNLGTGVGGTNPIFIKNMEVRSGATCDFASCSITLEPTSEKIKNNGRIRMSGTQTLVGAKENGTDSVIEYYGPLYASSGKNTLPWGLSYQNIEFTEGFATPSSGIDDAMTVSGTTLFVNGSGKTILITGNSSFSGIMTLGGGTAATAAGSISLAGNNSFGDKINIVKADDVTFSGTNSYSGTVTINQAGHVLMNGNNSGFTLEPFSASDSCTSLHVQCPVTIGNVNSTGHIAGTASNETQLYEKAVTLSSDTVLKGSANDLVHFGDDIAGGNHFLTTDTSDARFDGDISALTTFTVGAKSYFEKTTSSGSGTATQTVSSSGNQSFTGAVAISSDLSLISSGGDMTFSNTIDSLSASSLGSLSAQATEGDVLFNESVGGTVALTKLSVNSKNATVKENKSVTVSNTIDVTTGEKFTLEKNNAVTAPNGMTVTNTGLFYVGSGSSITAGSFVQNGAGLNQIACAFSCVTSASFATDTYIYDASSFTVQNAGGTKGTVSFGANLFISAAGKAVSFSAPVRVTKNYCLFNANVTQSENLTVTKDLVLLNGTSPSAMYDDNKYGDRDSDVLLLFPYAHTSRDGTTHVKPSLIDDFPLPAIYDGYSGGFPTVMPDGTTPITHTSYSSTFSGFSGKTISALQNFYVNGVNLAPGGSWNLTLKNNDSQLLAFAECYNCTISSCTANYALSAAENCTDGGSNSNVFFSRPVLNPNVDAIYTVYDDVIRVEFVDSLTGAVIKIENTNNEISRALAARTATWNTGTFDFIGSYYDADCTVSTDGRGDLSVFYIRTDSSGLESTWNTDATGTDAGNTDGLSTDRHGIHKNTFPTIEIIKARTSEFLYETLRDEHKNRIAQTTGSNRFTAATDHCQPVIVACYIGQEMHTEYDSAVGENSQKYYDAHNFIEFCYSEQVDIGGMPASGTAVEVNGTDVNVQATSSLGAIASGSSISVSGFATLNGAITSFSKTGSSSPHALYRTFSDNAADAPSYHPYRIRVSIAGYVDGTYTVSTGSFHNYPGCVDNLSSPTAITGWFETPLVKDISANSNTAGTYSSGHPLFVTVNNDPDDTIFQRGDMHGSWDTSRPTYAPYFLTYGDWSSSHENYEVIGSVNTPSSFLHNIEFHMFDNTPTYSESRHWAVKQGWISSDSDTGTVPDNVGGSRPFTDPITTGGIRRSSLAEAPLGFTYRVDGESSWRTFQNDEVSQSVKSVLFVNVGQSTGDDGLYFKISLNADDTRLPTSTIFKVKYDKSKAYVTDLAGNRLIDPTEIQTIDVTPPAFLMAIAPIGEKFSYFVFTKALAGLSSDGRRTELSSLSASERSNHFASLKDACSITDFDGFAKDLSIDKIEFVSQNKKQNYTILKFYFNRSVTLADIESTMLIDNGNDSDKAKNIFGIFQDNTYVFDTLGNYLEVGKKHCISEFAVNALNVLYAYATNGANDDGSDSEGWDEEGIYGTIAPESSNYATHDFTGLAGNYNKLRTERNITVQSQFVGDGTKSTGFKKPENGEIAELVPIKKSALTEEMISDKINYQFGTAWRLWLPYTLDSFATKKAVPESGTDGTAAGDDSGILKNFKLDNTSGNKYSWKAGDEIQFLFRIKDEDGNDFEIDNDGDDTTAPIPLYAVWMPNTAVTTVPFLDLWSFSLKDLKLQRGGVTILNNVINVSIREQTVVQVNMKESGNLSVCVTTLDGNVVKWLSKGHASEGVHNFKWDGTNKSGNPVARGLYFVRVVAPEIDETRKVMCVKD